MFDDFTRGLVLNRDLVVNVPAFLAEHAVFIFVATVTIFTVVMIRPMLAGWWREARFLAAILGEVLGASMAPLGRVAVFLLVCGALAGTFRAAYVYDTSHAGRLLDGWASLGAAPMGGLGYTTAPELARSAAPVVPASVEQFDMAGPDAWRLPLMLPGVAQISDVFSWPDLALQANAFLDTLTLLEPAGTHVSSKAVVPGAAPGESLLGDAALAGAVLGEAVRGDAGTTDTVGPSADVSAQIVQDRDDYASAPAVVEVEL